MLHRKKRGGRKPGSKTKRTIERAKAVAAITASGADPVTSSATCPRTKMRRLTSGSRWPRSSHPTVTLTSMESRTGGMGHEERLEKLKAMPVDAKAEPNGS